LAQIIEVDFLSLHITLDKPRFLFILISVPLHDMLCSFLKVEQVVCVVDGLVEAVRLLLSILRGSGLVESEHLEEGGAFLLLFTTISFHVLIELHRWVRGLTNHLILHLHLLLYLDHLLLLEGKLSADVSNLQVCIDQLLLQVLDLYAQFFDLLVFQLRQLLFLKLYLLVFILQVVEKFAHLSQLILMLQLYHLQLSVL